ncbi:hypothetical protein AU387_00165 [Bacillus halotolerans]|nr:hypothetical protein AU387_00165 [Bacillus halotolerans]OEC77178.1 hypothetical protein BCV60_05835 [Bacillus halotolerans]
MESEKDFRLKRVKYVIREMKEEGEVIKGWEVLRKAGIKKKFYEEIIEFLKHYNWYKLKVTYNRCPILGIPFYY